MPPSADLTMDIAAPPERVWYVLTHGEEFTLQSANVREIVTSSRREGVGATLRLTRGQGPLALVLDGVFTEWEPERRLSSTWRGGLPFRMRTMVQMRLEPTPDGTRLHRHYEWNFAWPAVGGWLAGRLRQGTTRDMALLMQRIKAAAELA